MALRDRIKPNMPVGTTALGSSWEDVDGPETLLSNAALCTGEQPRLGGVLGCQGQEDMKGQLAIFSPERQQKILNLQQGN